MKVVSNNKFRDKLTFLDNESTIKVKNFINLIDSFKKSKSLVDQSNTHNSNIYEYVLDDLKIFYTIESDYSGDETIILMDILKPTIKLGFSFKNPRTNTIYNPRTNTLINPRTNTLINPRTNTLINPRTNTLINPRTNTLINPRTNTLMNPSLNPSFNGRIIYNLDLDPIEFYVKASENFIVIFNYNYDFIKFGVKHSQKGYIIFDLNNNEMLEHYESNGQEGYNVFNDNNDWIGLVI